MSLARIKRLEAILREAQTDPAGLLFIRECPEGYRVDGKTFPSLEAVAKAHAAENPAGLRGVVVDAVPVAGAAISWRLTTLFPDGRIHWGRRMKLDGVVSDADAEPREPQAVDAGGES